MKIQVTFDCESGKYKPVSTLIEVPSTYAFYRKKEYWISRAKERIKAQRYWTDKDMEKFGYTSYRMRIAPDN